MAQINNLTSKDVSELEAKLVELKRTNPELLWAIYPMSEEKKPLPKSNYESEITKLELKIDSLNQKIDLIFGKYVLINGKFQLIP